MGFLKTSCIDVVFGRVTDRDGFDVGTTYMFDGGVVLKFVFVVDEVVIGIVGRWEKDGGVVDGFGEVPDVEMWVEEVDGGCGGHGLWLFLDMMFD